MYCAFIDYQMAFDTVIRDALWIKLIKEGFSCKVINMLKYIYSNVKSCVKLASSVDVSELFDVTLGLKQGEPLSPIFFILFVNDISNTIDFRNLIENDLNFLSMYMLLFADDISLFTTNPILSSCKKNYGLYF